MTLTDDTRLAATMLVGISTYVATAALAVMAGALVLYTFIASSFVVQWYFHALSAAGLLLLVMSIFVGGRESAVVTGAVADGQWDPRSEEKRLFGGGFNLQAVLTLLGVVIVIAATLTGVAATSEKSVTEQRIDDLVKQVQTLSHEAAEANGERERLAQDVRRLEQQLGS